ncbi:DUF294 nucleotidyltransferase-like domain-containing protein [Paenibacillus sp. MZ04-78.2]|uniref:DUF294 nucleotidyltransferase-like domain-containing protein n=1 Tax=Paenibacillus sp. MZ04-78.2 TaxID=2962034 RepID=UPI0020B83E2E|nr:DUF294 nucleotidyltransferase-like domain-containing protein [Paenibacillus sp. MZ04-78.2]MCP3772055.1 DUF294 nucleotidyltransferase-like domain-containing protein [Paenibacillus sp. MZ04-78.2]
MDRLALERFRWETSRVRSLQKLRGLRDQVNEEFGRHLLFGEALEWNREVNACHDALIRRVIALSEERLKEEQGKGAPLPYAFLLFGSGGRGEQTLWSDQDNGLIYADPSSADERLEAERYFAELAARITEGLETVGYPPCHGQVLCTNEQWRKPLQDYRRMVNDWMQEPDWERVRYLLITVDARTVYGDEALGRALVEEIYRYTAACPAILEHMLRNTLHHKVSLGVFGQLIRERYGEDAGGVDVKYGAYIPIVNGIRLLALESGVRRSSTEERIKALIEGGHVSEENGHDWLEALTLALKLRLMTPYQIEEGRYVTRGKLTADQLTKERVTELRQCFRIGADLQKYSRKAFTRR